MSISIRLKHNADPVCMLLIQEKTIVLTKTASNAFTLYSKFGGLHVKQRTTNPTSVNCFVKYRRYFEFMSPPAPCVKITPKLVHVALIVGYVRTASSVFS